MFWQTEDNLQDGRQFNDTEMLQTDIQRFVAILGLCLMAIFALLQSLAVTGTENKTIIKNAKLGLEEQETELHRLLTLNQALREKVDQLTNYGIQVKNLQEIIVKTKRALHQQSSQIGNLLKENLVREKDLVTLRIKLKQREGDIRQLKITNRQIEQKLQQAYHTVSVSKGLQKQIEALNKKLVAADQIEQELTDVREEKQRLEQLLKTVRRELDDMKDKKSKEEKIAGRTEPGEKSGNYVAFASDHIFMSMLELGKISLFIQIEGLDKGFRVSAGQGGIAFEMQVLEDDLDYWVVNEAMLPVNILQNFRTYTTLSLRPKIFVVGLPLGIAMQIRSRMGESGRHIINADGQVDFTPF